MTKIYQYVRDDRLIELMAKGLKYDEADYALLRQYTWHIDDDGYARTTLSKGKLTRMHNLLLGKTPEGMLADHENRDRLDNRRVNLRFLTVSDSNYNRTSLKGLITLIGKGVR